MFIQVIQGRTSDADGLRAAIDRWEKDLAPGAAPPATSTYPPDTPGTVAVPPTLVLIQPIPGCRPVSLAT